MKKVFWLLALFTACHSAPAVQNNNNVPVAHDAWDKLLQKHVSPSGKVNYQGFIYDSLELNKYLSLLSNSAPNNNWSSNEQKAYWINAYNAFTVQLIIRNYPLESIKDISFGVSVPMVNSPWDIKFIKIGNATYDLNNIEHGILRKRFDDPRIHFAIVCASESCPKLLNNAYVADKLDRQLDAQTVIFVNDITKNKISADKIEISKIFDWFQGDFTKKGSLIDFLNRYSKTNINPKARVAYMDYSWKLND
jgi:hypothetical protein